MVSVLLLAVGVGLVIAGAEIFLDGLLASSSRLGVSAFAPTAVLMAPIRAVLPAGALAWTAAGPVPLLVARVTVPSRRGGGDLALGSIAGTIVHFAAFNAGVIALVKPLELDAATRHLHLPTALAATLVLCATLWLCGGITRLIGARLSHALCRLYRSAIVIA
jgi:Ca2+/Na+ antiporter